MIVDEQDTRFSAALKAFADVFVADQSPPAQVFHELVDYCWLEFEEVLTGAFWECAVRCAEQAGDTSIFATCIEPVAAPNFGHSGVACFARSARVDEYHAFLDAGTPWINIRNVGNTSLVTGDSGRWGFHGDRGREILVGAHQPAMQWPLVKGLRYHTFDTMLKLVAAPWRGRPPAGLLATFEANYRSGSWPISTYQEG